MKVEEGTGPVSERRKKEALDFLRQGKDTGVVGGPGTKQTGVVDPSAALRRDLGRYQTEAKYKTLQSQGVDISSGGPAKVRTQLSATPKERRDELLNEAFPQGWRQTDLGVVATVPKEEGEGTREVLLDERGFSFGDVADMAGSAPEIAGAMGGAAAALGTLPATATAGAIGTGVVALAAALGGQVGGGITDGLQIMRTGGFDFDKKEDRQMLNRIVRERGMNVALDMFLDVGTVSGIKGLSAAGRTARAPFSSSASAPGREEINEAAERLGIELMPSEKTGSSAILRGEAIGEKIPGVGDVFERMKDAGTQGVRGYTDRLTQRRLTSEEVGERISQEATDEVRRRTREAGELRTQAQRTLEREIQSIADQIYRDGRVDPSRAGQMARMAIQQRKLEFDQKQDALENEAGSLVAQLPEKKQNFVPTDGIKDAAAALEQKLPPELSMDIDAEGNLVETLKQNQELTPGRLGRIIKGVQKLPENVKPEQLRAMRALISEQINSGEAVSAFSQGELMNLEKAMTEALERGIKKAPNKQVGQAMRDALDHYKNNVDQFRNDIVSRAISRSPGEAGGIEDRQVLPELLLNNRGEQAQRVMDLIGPRSEAARASRRAAFEELIRRSRNREQDLDAIDPDKLFRQIEQLNKPTRKALFRERGEFPVLDRLRRLRARYDYLPADAFRSSGEEADPIEMLKRAKQMEDELQQQFHTRVFKRFLKGEVDESAMSPSKFVRFSLNNASANEVKQMMDRLSPETAREYQKAVMVQLLDRASSEFNTAEDAARFVETGGALTGSGDRLVRQFRKYADDPEDSIKKLKNIINYKTMRDVVPDSPQRGNRTPFNVLEDLAKINAARSQRAKAGEAAGGLVGGSILTNLAALNVRTAGRVAKYRIIAELLARPATRNWLTKRLPKNRQQASKVWESYQYALPEIANVLGNELGEDYESAQSVAELFRPENVEQVLTGAGQSAADAVGAR
jgi:hypothetical protein